MPDWKWFPQFTGLIRDPEGKHHKTMGVAIWLYNFFCADANRKTGEWVGQLNNITERTGIQLWTIKRYMQILKKGGYITAKRKDNGIEVKISKYKTLVLQENGAPTMDDISKKDDRAPLEKNLKSKEPIKNIGTTIKRRIRFNIVSKIFIFFSSIILFLN